MNPAIFYGPCRVNPVSVAVGAAALTQLCQEDHSRLGLILGVSGVNSVQVSPRRSVTASSGLTLGQNGMPVLLLDFSSWGPLVGAAWWGIGAAATVVEVIEVLRDEDPERRLGLPPEV